MDCSSFTEYVYSEYGKLAIGTCSSEQIKTGLRDGFEVVAVEVYDPQTGLNIEKLMPGDLVFFQNTYNALPPTHVGIYVGDGMFVHMSTSANGPKMEKLLAKYWVERWYAARRIIVV